jgi:hypothetical protein
VQADANKNEITQFHAIGIHSFYAHKQKREEICIPIRCGNDECGGDEGDARDKINRYVCLSGYDDKIIVDFFKR